MPKVIVKCRYYKSGSGKGLGGYMNKEIPKIYTIHREAS